MRKNVTVLMPVGAGIPNQTRDSLNALADLTGWQVLEGRGSMSVEYVRSFLAAWWLQELDTDWAMWIDSDHVFAPEQCVELIDRAEENGLLFLSGFYVQKRQPSTIPAADWTGERVLGLGGGIQEMKRNPFGFVATHRKLFTIMGRELPLTRLVGEGREFEERPYFFPVLERREGKPALWMQDDWSFCHRVAEAGLPVLTDTRIVVGHVGQYVFDLDDLIPRKERVGTINLTLEEQERK